MTPQLNVAIVGLGYWGPNRLRVLSELADVHVSWICDANPGRLQRAAARRVGPRATTDLDVILADRSIDAVILATPVFTHHALATRCLEAGKHVFVEKPLAASSGEAQDLVELAARVDRVLFCGHTFLYSPPVKTIKEILDRGELGDIHFISSSRVNLGPYRSDVSVIFDLGPHDLSILRYWLGVMPEHVGAVGRDAIQEGIADVAFLHLVFPDGLLAHVELSWLAPSKLRRTVIVGSEKMLIYEDGSPEPVRLFDSGIEYEDPEDFGQYQLSYRTGDIVSVRVANTEPIVAEMTDFVSTILHETTPISDTSVALDVIRTVEAAEASMSNEGRRVSIAPARLSARGGD